MEQNRLASEDESFNDVGFRVRSKAEERECASFVRSMAEKLLHMAMSDVGGCGER